MYEYAAKLVRAVDGDTVILDLDLGFYSWRIGQSYRLLRIDAPELPTLEGVVSREALKAFLVGKTLLARTHKADSFGRFLVELTADGINVSDWMVSNKLARYREYRAEEQQS